MRGNKCPDIWTWRKVKDDGCSLIPHLTTPRHVKSAELAEILADRTRSGTFEYPRGCQRYRYCEDWTPEIVSHDDLTPKQVEVLNPQRVSHILEALWTTRARDTDRDFCDEQDNEVQSADAGPTRSEPSITLRDMIYRLEHGGYAAIEQVLSDFSAITWDTALCYGFEHLATRHAFKMENFFMNYMARLPMKGGRRKNFSCTYCAICTALLHGQSAQSDRKKALALRTTKKFAPLSSHDLTVDGVGSDSATVDDTGVPGPGINLAAELNIELYPPEQLATNGTAPTVLNQNSQDLDGHDLESPNKATTTKRAESTIETSSVVSSSQQRPLTPKSSRKRPVEEDCIGVETSTESRSETRAKRLRLELELLLEQSDLRDKQIATAGAATARARNELRMLKSKYSVLVSNYKQLSDRFQGQKHLAGDGAKSNTFLTRSLSQKANLLAVAEESVNIWRSHSASIRKASEEAATKWKEQAEIVEKVHVEELEKLREKHQEVQKEVENLRHDAIDRSELHQEIERLKEENAELQAKLASNSEEREILQSDVADLRDIRTAMFTKFDSAIQQLADLRTEIGMKVKKPDEISVDV